MTQVSNDGYAFIAAHEAGVLTMYPDSHSPAIGFGLNIAALKPGDTITLEQAVEQLVDYGTKLAKKLAVLFPDLPQTCFDAVASLAFNLGVTGLTRDNLDIVQAILDFQGKQDDTELQEAAAQSFLRAHVKGKPPPFNLSRRADEAHLFQTGDYGNITKLKLWGPGLNPHTTRPSIVPMPTFVSSK